MAECEPLLGGGAIHPSDEPGGYIDMLDGERIVVPARAVLDRIDNPTGLLVLCFYRANSGGAPAWPWNVRERPHAVPRGWCLRLRN